MELSHYVADKEDNSFSLDENFDFMKQHFLLAKKIINERYPDTKVAILKYEDSVSSEISSSEWWKELEEEGFIILDSYDLTGDHLSKSKYKIADGHPNEKAWDVLTPMVVKALKL